MLVEDDEFVIRALLRWYGDQAEFVVHRTLREAEARSRDRWAAAIIDRGLPDGDGLRLAKKMAARASDATVVVFSGADPRVARSEATRRGIIYLDKNDGTAVLGRMITTWANSHRNASNAPHDRLAALAATHGLSERECEVLRQRLAGKTRSQAARALRITEATHRNHVTHILSKTGFTRLAQLIAHLTAKE